MILGKETLWKLTALLTSEGFEVAQTSEIPQALNTMRQKHFDVILVDSLLPKAEEACCLIKETVASPVALITNGHQIDWNKFRSMDVDGFVPEKAAKSELVARLRAISRGSANNGKV